MKSSASEQGLSFFITSGKEKGIFSRVLLSNTDNCLMVFSCELKTSDKPYNAKPPTVNLPATFTSDTAMLLN